MSDVILPIDIVNAGEQSNAKNILSILNEYGRISRENLSCKLNIEFKSLESLLDIMGDNEMLLRTKSSVIAMNQVRYRIPKDKFPQEVQDHNVSEELIAKAAVKYIRPNDTIYITSGSVGFLMTKYLNNPELPLTFVTNSVVMANEVKYFENLDVNIVGGTMRRKGTLVDAMAVRCMKEMHVDVGFFTGAGLTAEGGLTNNTNDVIEWLRTAMQSCRRNILLMPAVKLGFRSFLKVVDADAFNLLITDEDAYPPALDKISAMGVPVEIA